MQQSCNSWCNRDATEMQQRCNSVDAGKAPCVLNGGGGGGGGGGWAVGGVVVGGWGLRGQMPPRYATQMARMEAVGRARRVRVKMTRVETGHSRPRRALAAASTPGSDRNAGKAPAAPISAPGYAGPVSRRGRRRAAGRPRVTVSTPPQQGPRAAAQPPVRRGSAAPAGRGIVRAGRGSREAVANLSGAGARAPAPGNLASGPARGGGRGRTGNRGGRGRAAGADGAGGGGEAVGGLDGWLTRGPRGV